MKTKDLTIQALFKDGTVYVARRYQRSRDPSCGRSFLRNIVIALVVFFAYGVASAVQEQSVFRDMRLVLSFYDDADNPLLEMSAPNVGQSFTIYMFVPEAAGMRSVGFQVNFQFLNLRNMYRFTTILNGNAYDGSALFVNEEYPQVSALLVSKPTIPASGFIGSVTFKVLEALPEGNRWIFSGHASMGDPDTNQNDRLNTDDGLLKLIGKPQYVVASIPGDLDLDGDVDFNDFLIFTGNYGRVGDPPQVPEPQTVYVTVRDTVYIDRPGADTPQMARAHFMQGFWHFGTAFSADQPHLIDTFGGFLLGEILHPDPDEYPELKGEKVVMGAAFDGSLAAMGYNPDNENYILSYKFVDDDDLEDESLEFRMIQNRPIGFWVSRNPQTGQIISSSLHISNDSGKGYHPNSGFVNRMASANKVAESVPGHMRFVERLARIINQ